MGESIFLPSPTFTNDLAAVSLAANQFSQRTILQREMSEKSKNTLIAYKTDIATWCQFLAGFNIVADPVQWLERDEMWSDVKHGLIDAFVEWMKGKGFAIATINRKLSTIRKRFAIAVRAGYVDGSELTLVKGISAISRAAGVEIDRRRTARRIDRPQAKKEASARLLPEQAAMLLDQPDTPQGKRDAVLMHLLLRHGLRAGEIAALQVENINLRSGFMTFYRDKVNKTQRHRLGKATVAAFRAYLACARAPKEGCLLLRSKKNGELLSLPMNEWGITMRAKELARRIGVDGFSAHDGRHHWATDAVTNKTDPFALKNAGGWSNMNTVSRYVEDAAIANEGVVLSG